MHKINRKGINFKGNINPSSLNFNDKTKRNRKVPLYLSNASYNLGINITKLNDRQKLHLAKCHDRDNTIKCTDVRCPWTIIYTYKNKEVEYIANYIVYEKYIHEWDDIYDRCVRNNDPILKQICLWDIEDRGNLCGNEDISNGVQCYTEHWYACHSVEASRYCEYGDGCKSIQCVLDAANNGETPSMHLSNCHEYEFYKTDLLDNDLNKYKSCNNNSDITDNNENVEKEKNEEIKKEKESIKKDNNENENVEKEKNEQIEKEKEMYSEKEKEMMREVAEGIKREKTRKEKLEEKRQIREKKREMEKEKEKERIKELMKEVMKEKEVIEEKDKEVIEEKEVVKDEITTMRKELLYLQNTNEERTMQMNKVILTLERIERILLNINN